MFKSTTNESKSARRFAGKLAVGAAALGMGATALLGVGVTTAQSAGAATPAVTYAYSFNTGCTTISGYYESLSYTRPVDVANYAGTTGLTWFAMVYRLVGNSWQYVGGYNQVSATIWGYSGTQIASIYWNNQPNNYWTGVTTTPGYTYAVLGVTTWYHGNTTQLSQNLTTILDC